AAATPTSVTRWCRVRRAKSGWPPTGWPEDEVARPSVRSHILDEREKADCAKHWLKRVAIASGAQRSQIQIMCCDWLLAMGDDIGAPDALDPHLAEVEAAVLLLLGKHNGLIGKHWPMKPATGFSILGEVHELKNCIGKELTRIAMPISFNEPLSFLPACVTEYLEYSKLLFQSGEYIAALVFLGPHRTGTGLSKPFNPLCKGETYELDRTLAISGSAQVWPNRCRHHPPTSAYHAKAADGSLAVSRSRVAQAVLSGCKTVDVAPKGVVTWNCQSGIKYYTYQNVPCKCGDVTHHKPTGPGTGASSAGAPVVLVQLHDYHPDQPATSTTGRVRKQKALYGKWVDAFYSVPADAWGQFKRGGHSPTNARITKSATMTTMNQHVRLQARVPTTKRQRASTKAGLRSSQSNRSLGSAPASRDSVNSADGAEDNLLAKPRCDYRHAPVWPDLPVGASGRGPQTARKYYNFTSLRHGFKTTTRSGAAARLPPTDSRRRPDVARAFGEWRDSEAGAVGEGPAGGKDSGRLLKLAGGLEAALFEPALAFEAVRNPHSGSKEADCCLSGDYWGPGLTPLRAIFCLMVDALWFVNRLTVWMRSFFAETRCNLKWEISERLHAGRLPADVCTAGRLARVLTPADIAQPNICPADRFPGFDSGRLPVDVCQPTFAQPVCLRGRLPGQTFAWDVGQRDSLQADVAARVCQWDVWASRSLPAGTLCRTTFALGTFAWRTVCSRLCPARRLASRRLPAGV
uniref:YDG domain-containing protein n=1 Tax=Macrostomum lignano TaxID=282301 RepID=A0A1I8FGL1_9PLAT